MTNKEKQLKMLEALDLRVGDMVEATLKNGKKKIYKIEENSGDKSIRLFDIRNIYTIGIEWLLYYDFEVVEYHQKTWGEYKCRELKCSECPIRFLDCTGNVEDTLSDNVDKNVYRYPKTEKGKKIYEMCKEMLNEVRDEK